MRVSSDAGTRGSGAEYSMRRRNFLPIATRLACCVLPAARWFNHMEDGVESGLRASNIILHEMNHALSCVTNGYSTHVRQKEGRTVENRSLWPKGEGVY